MLKTELETRFEKIDETTLPSSGYSLHYTNAVLTYREVCKKGANAPVSRNLL